MLQPLSVGHWLACAVFIMWPEALHMIPKNMKDPNEADIAGTFGACVLVGFDTTLVQWITMLTTGKSHGHQSVSPNDVVENKLEAGKLQKKARVRPGSDYWYRAQRRIS